MGPGPELGGSRYPARTSRVTTILVPYRAIVGADAVRPPDRDRPDARVPSGRNAAQMRVRTSHVPRPARARSPRSGPPLPPDTF